MSLCNARGRDLCVVGASFAGRAAIPVVVIVLNLSEPVVDDTAQVDVAAHRRADPVVLSDHVEPDVVAVKRHVTILIST